MSSSSSSTSESSSASSSLFPATPGTTTPPSTFSITAKSPQNAISKTKSILSRRRLTLSSLPQLFRSSSTQATASGSMPPASPQHAPSPSSSPLKRSRIVPISKPPSTLPPPSPREPSRPVQPLLKRATTTPFNGLRPRLSMLNPVPRLLFPSSDAPTKMPSRYVFRQMKHESRCLQHIAHGIYVAFEDDKNAFTGPEVQEDYEDLRAECGNRFNHVIHIIRAENFFVPATTNYHTDRQRKIRHLTISALPHSHHQYELQMKILSQDPELLALTPEQAQVYFDASYYSASYLPSALDGSGIARLGARQMVASREFIKGAISTSEAPRILVVAPRDHRSDVISVVVCALASAGRRSAVELVNEINRRKDVKSVWQGCISRQGAEYIREFA